MNEIAQLFHETPTVRRGRGGVAHRLDSTNLDETSVNVVRGLVGARGGGRVGWVRSSRWQPRRCGGRDVPARDRPAGRARVTRALCV